MSLAVAIQMDPIETVDIDADSTFVLALEAQARQHELFHYLPEALVFQQNRLYARAQPLQVRRERGNHFSLGEAELLDLATMDVILMRQDPPFDMSYITATHLLEHVHPQTLVVNDPSEVRNAPEKLFVTNFSELMPPTMITSSRDDILAFRRDYKDIIVKPLFGNGGAGVFHVTPEDENLNSLLEMFTEFYREPIIIQQYMPAVREGDKRIILIDGKPVGGLLRVPPLGEARANMHVGAVPLKTELTSRERDICASIGPILSEKGLLFVGIDVIGGYVTEINVTSPTGIQEINRFDNVSLESQLWNAIEERRSQNSNNE
jgi:glutathione synthase